MYQEAQVTEGQFISLDKYNEEMERNNRALIAATTERDRLRKCIDEAKTIIVGFVQDDTLDKDEAETLAAALDISLTRRVAVTVSAEIVVMLEVDASVDNGDITSDDFDVTLDYLGDERLITTVSTQTDVSSVEEDY